MGFRPFRRFGEPLGGKGFGQVVSPDLTAAQLILNTQPSNLIGYWPLGEASGTVADDVSSTNADAAYAATFTLAQPGIGDGSLSVLFNGGRAKLGATNVATLNTAYADKSKGTILCWCKAVNAGVWTDGNTRTLIEFGADLNNRAGLSKFATNGQVQGIHIAGGTTKFVQFTTSSPLTFFMTAITWDKAAGASGELKFFFSGVQQGATQTNLGTWTGNLSDSWTAIADYGGGGATDRWNGYEAHCALWKVALTPAQIAGLYIPSHS